MKMDEIIKEINALYHKSQSEGLTPEEKERQSKLRRIYIDSVTGNLTTQLDNISIENEDGTVELLGKKFGKKPS